MRIWTWGFWGYVVRATAVSPRLASKHQMWQKFSWQRLHISTSLTSGRCHNTSSQIWLLALAANMDIFIKISSWCSKEAHWLVSYNMIRTSNYYLIIFPLQTLKILKYFLSLRKTFPFWNKPENSRLTLTNHVHFTNVMFGCTLKKFDWYFSMSEPVRWGILQICKHWTPAQISYDAMKDDAHNRHCSNLE